MRLTAYLDPSTYDPDSPDRLVEQDFIDAMALRRIPIEEVRLRPDARLAGRSPLLLLDTGNVA